VHFTVRNDGAVISHATVAPEEYSQMIKQYLPLLAISFALIKSIPAKIAWHEHCICIVIEIAVSFLKCS